MNIISVFVTKSVAILCSFVFTIVLAQTLSPSDVGIFLTGITLMSATSIIVKSGFDTNIIRINAGSPYKFSNYCSLTLLTFIPYIFILILGSILYLKDRNIFLYFIVATWCISHFGISASYLRSLGKTKIASIIEISLLHLFVTLIYLFLPTQINLHISATIFLIISIIFSLFLFFLLFIKKNKDEIFKWKFNFKNNFSNSFSIMLTNLLDFLVIWLPSFILFSYAATEIAAQFQIAMRISLLTALPLAIINSISSPIIAIYLKRKLNSKLSELLKISSLFGIVLTIILIFLLLIFHNVIFKLFGDSYLVEFSIIMVLLIAQLINVLSGSVGLTLSLSGNGWIHCKNSFIAIILSIVVAFIIIPKDFIIGAAISTSLAIIVKNLLGIFYVNKLFGIITLPNKKTFSNLNIKKLNEIFAHRN